MAADPAAAGHEARRVALFTLIAWLPIVLLATLQGYALNEHHGRAVVLDFSAYAFLIAVAAFVLQTLPACDEPFDDGVGKVAGFSLHASGAATVAAGQVAGVRRKPCRQTRGRGGSGHRVGA